MVALEGETILAVGSSVDVMRGIGERSVRTIDADGGTVIPGYVDCHTHLVFGGDRSREYFARMRGLDDAGLRAEGVPFDVPASIARNRDLSVDDLVMASLPRLRRMLEAGTTTLETKSGYGLTPDSDIRSLEAARELGKLVPVEIVASYLGAHIVPPSSTKERFLSEILEEALPRVASRQLAEFCDVYCDPNVFNLKDTERVLRRASELGFKLKLHVDAKNNIGGTRLAAEMGAASCDHVNHTTVEDFRALAAAGTVAVTFPGFDFIVNHRSPTNINAVRASGVTLAVGTDQCPVCWLESMQVATALGCRINRMTPEEALRGGTIHAAMALGLHHRLGSLEPGKQADLVILDVPSFEQAAFRFATNCVAKVIKKGRVVVDRRATDHRSLDGFERASPRELTARTHDRAP
ncbi:MAG: imidazolonepropionase [Burkholderiales bacterium]|nr:imidazolonepropionase [Burkholderiales bacterium]